MTRLSKPEQRRNQSPRKFRYKVDTTTGPKKDNLPQNYRVHVNVLDSAKVGCFFPKVKGV